MSSWHWTRKSRCSLCNTRESRLENLNWFYCTCIQYVGVNAGPASCERHSAKRRRLSTSGAVARHPFPGRVGRVARIGSARRRADGPGTRSARQPRRCERRGPLQGAAQRRDGVRAVGPESRHGRRGSRRRSGKLRSRSSGQQAVLSCVCSEPLARSTDTSTNRSDRGRVIFDFSSLIIFSVPLFRGLQIMSPVI